MMLHVITEQAILDVRPGHEEEAVALFDKLTEATRAEPGCRMYLAHRSTTDPRKFFLYEQYVDVAAEADLDADGLRHMHALKTGRLIGASVAVAPLLLGAPVAAQVALARYAEELGLLFQIVDDILDVTGTEDALGKPQGSDERHGKLTYVSQYGVEGARTMAADSHRNALQALREAGGAPDLEHITDFIYKRTS